LGFILKAIGGFVSKSKNKKKLTLNIIFIRFSSIVSIYLLYINQVLMVALTVLGGQTAFDNETNKFDSCEVNSVEGDYKLNIEKEIK
jgi:hypothetical protein